MNLDSFSRDKAFTCCQGATGLLPFLSCQQAEVAFATHRVNEHEKEVQHIKNVMKLKAESGHKLGFSTL